MKLDTAVIISKGAAHLFVGAFTPWTAALAQWANSGEMPPKIIWLGVILPLSVVGGASALLAFLSGSFGTYRKAKSDEDATTRLMKSATEIKT